MAEMKIVIALFEGQMYVQCLPIGEEHQRSQISQRASNIIIVTRKGNDLFAADDIRRAGPRRILQEFQS